MYRTFLNPVTNCVLDISLPLENVSYELFAVQQTFEKKQVSTSLHLQSINNIRPANIPPPPDSTVNWDSRSNRTWPSPCQSNPITTRRAKSQHGTSPNFVPCLTPGGSQYITQGTCTHSTNPFHRTTASRRRRET